MKKRIKNLMILLLIMFVTINKFDYIYNVDAFNGPCEIVMDVYSGRVLFSNNAMEKKYMASTTKILTAITIIENCDLNSFVRVTDETVGIEGSSIYLEKEEILTVRDLLYGLMLRSGNDCAETLAMYCGGSIESFARMMNQTAQNIGAVNSNFVNPHGLHNVDHYTTAYDLALISCYSMKNKDFRQIVGTKSIDIPFTTRNCNRHLLNKNKLLTTLDGATGIKTGYTKKAGRCLVSSCLRGDMELVCVVLDCPPMFERSMYLLNESFNKYKPYKIFESDNIIDFIDVLDSDSVCPVCIKNDLIIPLTDEEHNTLEIFFDCPEKLSLPIRKDDEVGLIKIYSQNNLIFTQKLFSIVDIN